MGRRFRAIIFDLDDTLYAEADYIVSGYRTVCSILAERGFNVTVDEMFSLFRASRNHVFDRAALQFTFPREWVAELIEAYRSHAPILVLESQIQSVLMLLRQSYKIGILTDGWKNVQQKKIDALKIHQYCDAVIVADEFGYDYWKPNPAIFRICCERLEVSTMETLVVGDNPARDMAGARAAGMAISIRRQVIARRMLKSLRWRSCPQYFACSTSAMLLRMEAQALRQQRLGECERSLGNR